MSRAEYFRWMGFRNFDPSLIITENSASLLDLIITDSPGFQFKAIFRFFPCLGGDHPVEFLYVPCANHRNKLLYKLN